MTHRTPWRRRALARTALVLALLGGTAGCALGDSARDVRTDLAIPDRFAVSMSPDQGASIANTKWFDIYRDPALQAVITEALEHNLDLQLALARVEESRARAVVARSRLFPSVDGQLSTSPTPQANSNDSNFTVGLLFSWEIDLFGRNRRLSDAARAEYLATQAGRNAVVSTLVRQVASTWLSIRELRREEDILTENARLQEQSLRLVQALHRGGIVSDTEEQQAVAQLAGTQALLPQVVQLRLVNENILAMLVGRYPAASLGPAADAPSPFGQDGGVAMPLNVPSELLSRRPDVLAAEQVLLAAAARESAAMRNRFPFPTIGLGAVFGRSSGELGSLFDSVSSVSLNSWGPSVNLPILNFGRDSGTVAIASAQTRQALVAYRKTVQQALFDVNQAVYSHQAASNQIGPISRQVTAARRLVQLQELRFKSGVNSYLDLLDAQRQQLSTELALSRAMLDQDLALIDLYAALGGGWDPDAPAS